MMPVEESVQTRQAVAEVRNLRVRFQSEAGLVHAVDGVSFDVPEGQILGLVGETGSGKSVTARSFIQLLPVPPAIIAGGAIWFRPRVRCDACRGEGCAACSGRGTINRACPQCAGSGCAACDGEGREKVDLLAVSDGELQEIRGGRIAMIFQDPDKALNPVTTIREQVGDVFYQHRADHLLNHLNGDLPRWVLRLAQQRSRILRRALLKLPGMRGHYRRLESVVDDHIEDALAETQIANPRKVMDGYPHELSGGMKQRVVIAQALACNPDLLIADEPTTALDVTVQARILHLILRLQRRTGITVLYISHDLSLVRQLCDRVVVMYAGRVVEEGDATQVLSEPLHPYTRGLLAAIPSMAHRRGELAAITGTVPELLHPARGCCFKDRCPYATDMCAEIDPPLETSDGTSHAAACLIYSAADQWSGDRPDLKGGEIA